MRGASTISQQVAKNVFLWQGRSWVRKGLEAWYTVLIELFWPKQRILEMYLNVAEFGDGVYGAQAAAQQFWGQGCGRFVADRIGAPGGGVAIATALRRAQSRCIRAAAYHVDPAAGAPIGRPCLLAGTMRVSTIDTVQLPVSLST